MTDGRAAAVIPSVMTESANAYQYSPGVTVRAGRLLFVSGQVGRAPHQGVLTDPEAQFVKACENLEAIGHEAGGTLGDVVEITTYLTSMQHLPLLAKVKERFFTTAPYPAWTGIGVQELALPGLLLEVKATA